MIKKDPRVNLVTLNISCPNTYGGEPFTTPEKLERFHREIRTFETRWPEIMKNGDPYYNPNLSLETQDFSLKRL